MEPILTLKNKIPFEVLSELLKKIEFRGLYNKNSEKIKPYKKAKFSIVTIFPSKELGGSPLIKVGSEKKPLFSPQPTIYLNQTEIIKTVNDFLEKNHKMSIKNLGGSIEYDWEGRGIFHMLPPIIEKHIYVMKDGFVDLDILIKHFEKFFVKDANENLHEISDRYLHDFYIDEVSSIKHMDLFHSNAPLINYGLHLNGKNDFYIVCDGMHRIDYAMEYLREPINVILVEPESKPLIPYYAFPMPFRPSIRLSSKQSEKMYPRLERDKVHLFNDFLKKVLHYDWSPAGLNISKLRSNVEIF